MKVVQAIPSMPGVVTENEVKEFLNNRLNIQLATVDENGYPNIQPLWFYYDSESEKLYIATRNSSKKIQNLKRNPDKIYFSIDDENFPYKGVKGGGNVSISEDIEKNVKIIEKIILKYLNSLEHPLGKSIMEAANNGTEVVVEVSPRFFSAWDFSKAGA